MAVRLVQELHPDVAVLDIGMPVLNGIEAVKEIRRSVQGTHTVLLTMHEDEIYMVEALKAGARGYVLKTQSDSDLVQSIRAVALGAIYLAPGISGRVMHTITSNSQSSEELSVRERQVLEMIAQGKTTREIAATLSLSPKTIESHRGRIMQKLDLHQMAQLVSYAVRHQLIKT
jgi:DNA-binding NarL/FixJ family response regulator